jgi:SAM-dependent methyltransferase
LDRAAKVFAGIQRGARVLELGPSFSPFAPKSEGWDACVVDHATREELIEKYGSDAAVDVSRIEDVDVVWDRGPLDEALPATSLGTFDAVIASHLIEHIPDPIGLLQSLEKALRTTGVVSLVVPDKRFCFDYYKPISSTGELLAAHQRRATRHSRRALFDEVAYSVTSEGAIGWSRTPPTNLAFFHTFAEAKRHVGKPDPTERDPYADCHGWHFTPSSFELNILELAALEAIDFAIDRTFPTEGTEFFVTLRRGRRVPADDDELQALRLGLLHRMFEEVGEQIGVRSEGSITAQTRAAIDLAPETDTDGRDDFLRTYEAEIEALRGERDDALQKYESVTASRSWRLTAPLRGAAMLIRRLRRALR